MDCRFQVLDSGFFVSGTWIPDSNRPFQSFPGPLFQNKGRCSALDMEIIFHSHANKSHFHKKGCAPSLILKVRVGGTWKWPIVGGIQDTLRILDSASKISHIPDFTGKNF